VNFGGLGRAVSGLYDALVNRAPRAAALGFLAGVRKDVRRAFAQSVDPATGDPFPPLQYRTGTPLVLSGRMRAAALAAVDGATARGTGVDIPLNDPPYSEFHQRGTARVPRRRFFAASPATVAAARRQYAGEVVRLFVGRAG